MIFALHAMGSPMSAPRLASISTALLASTTLASADPVFDRIASFPVNANLPAEMDQATETSSEIIAASDDGTMLVYSDSPLGAIGFVDISDPADPAPGGVVMLDGEPTAVSVAGSKVLVGFNTSESYTEPSGGVAVVDMESREIEATCDLGGQPDSTAVAPDGSFVAVAVENERDEDLDDGVIPQMPAGYVAILPLADGIPDCDRLVRADVTGLAEVAGSDPEPEFLDINADGEIAVTLQENNHVVVLSAVGEVLSHFSAGAVDLEDVDVDEEGALMFDGTLPDVPREPDAVQWLGTDRLVTANEGDYEGGSRGFTVFDREGAVLFESGLAFEYEVAMAGHYPEGRSGNKGAEPEGMEVGTFGGEDYIFLLSERGSVIGVYQDTGADPEFVQLLPTALAPEGAVAIPGRGLLAVSNEADLIEVGGVRSHVTLYAYQEDGVPAYPMIRSALDDAGRPIGFGALSGLAADPETPDTLYAVNDSFYALQPTIFTIDATQTPARITAATPVTRGGANAQLLDLEGITPDGEGGFWLASEGRTDRMTPHGLYRVNSAGEIEQSVPFPPELLAVERRFGAEGIARVGDRLVVALQREWHDDPDGFVKLVTYDLETEGWGAVHYPLDVREADAGWVGLSEITAHGDHIYIVERDNQIGAAARIKRLYRVAVDQIEPAELGGDLPIVEKEIVRDFLPDLSATGGYVVDKVEGFAIDAAGQGYAVTDNDGVDDSNGETLFFRAGKY
jgi:hypothetical protein